MDDSQENLIKTVRMLSNNFFACLKNLLMADLNYPYKQELKESINSLRTLENIHLTSGLMSQNALLEETPGAGKNLLACDVSGEAQRLFFNISGSEFIELYVDVDIAKVRKFFERVWNK